MTGTCSVLPQGAGFISSVTGYIDCQAQALGSGAWAALAAPGSTLMVTLTAFLTIFIALIGYNLLLGATMTVRSATVAFVKIGAVFALATSWPAYRTLVYDLAVKAPSQLVTEIGPQAGVVGSDGTLLQRLDMVDHGLIQLAILGPGQTSSAQYEQVPPPPFSGFDAFALGGSRILFLITAIAGLSAVRMVAGLMLAFGPFFIAFLMFDSTRALFEGWVRVIGGATLASVGVAVVLGLELALIEPWLASALARRMAGEPLPDVATELFVLALLFAILVAAALYACARGVWAFRLPQIAHVEQLGGASSKAREPQSSAAVPVRGQEAERSRAAALASMFSTMSRRDAVVALVSPGPAPAGRIPGVHTSVQDGTRADAPLGRSFSRRTTSRISARAAKRDKGS